MARFTAGVNSQSTLKIQLTAPPTGWDEITAISAASQVEIGTVSRPQLIRPITAGVGTSSHEAIQPLSGQGVPRDARTGAPGGTPVSPGASSLSASTFVTNFSIEPEMPIVVNPTIRAPISMHVRLSPGRGVIVPAGESIVLYAVSSQVDHLWLGRVEWEEL